MTDRISYRWPLACGALLAGAMAAFGHGNATGIVGERMMGMMMLSEQVKILAPIADDLEPGDLDTVREAAAMIEMHAGPAMTDLFPEGSTEAPSEAKLAIWERWEEFDGYSKRLGKLGKELAASADAESRPAAAATEIVAMQVPEEPELSEWDRMSFASLMGLAPVQPQEVDMVTTASIVPATPTVRPVREVYADITDTCASCHAAFRQ